METSRGDVEIRSRQARARRYRKKHMVRVELEDGDEIDVDASRVAVTEPATALDVSSSFQDAQAKAVAPLDPCFEELPPDQREELAAVLKFEAPSMEALAVLPRADDTVKVSDGDERFWTLARLLRGNSRPVPGRP